MFMLKQKRVSEQVKLIRHHEVRNRFYRVGEGSVDRQSHQHKIFGRVFIAEPRV